MLLLARPRLLGLASRLLLLLRLLHLHLLLAQQVLAAGLLQAAGLILLNLQLVALLGPLVLRALIAPRLVHAFALLAVLPGAFLPCLLVPARGLLLALLRRRLRHLHRWLPLERLRRLGHGLA